MDNISLVTFIFVSMITLSLFCLFIFASKTWSSRNKNNREAIPISTVSLRFSIYVVSGMCAVVLIRQLLPYEIYYTKSLLKAEKIYPIYSIKNYSPEFLSDVRNFEENDVVLHFKQNYDPSEIVKLNSDKKILLSKIENERQKNIINQPYQQLERISKLKNIQDNIVSNDDKSSNNLRKLQRIEFKINEQKTIVEHAESEIELARKALTKGLITNSILSEKIKNLRISKNRLDELLNDYNFHEKTKLASYENFQSDIKDALSEASNSKGSFSSNYLLSNLELQLEKIEAILDMNNNIPLEFKAPWDGVLSYVNAYPSSFDGDLIGVLSEHDTFKLEVVVPNDVPVNMLSSSDIIISNEELEERNVFLSGIISDKKVGDEHTIVSLTIEPLPEMVRDYVLDNKIKLNVSFKNRFPTFSKDDLYKIEQVKPFIYTLLILILSLITITTFRKKNNKNEYN